MLFWILFVELFISAWKMITSHYYKTLDAHCVLCPGRLRGHALSLRHARLRVSIHPPCRLLAATPGGHRRNSLLTDRHGGLLINCYVIFSRINSRERDTDQLQGELCDGSVSASQLLSELLHLLQESLHLITYAQVRDGGKGILGNVGFYYSSRRSRAWLKESRRFEVVVGRPLLFK